MTAAVPGLLCRAAFAPNRAVLRCRARSRAAFAPSSAVLRSLLVAPCCAVAAAAAAISAVPYGCRGSASLEADVLRWCCFAVNAVLALVWPCRDVSPCAFTSLAADLNILCCSQKFQTGSTVLVTPCLGLQLWVYRVYYYRV